MNVCLYRARLVDTKSGVSYIDGQKVPHIRERQCYTKKACFVDATTDPWISKAVKAFAMYTAHFIADSWSLQSYVLAT